MSSDLSAQGAFTALLDKLAVRMPLFHRWYHPQPFETKAVVPSVIAYCSETCRRYQSVLKMEDGIIILEAAQL